MKMSRTKLPVPESNHDYSDDESDFVGYGQVKTEKDMKHLEEKLGSQDYRRQIRKWYVSIQSLFYVLAHIRTKIPDISLSLVFADISPRLTWT